LSDSLTNSKKRINLYLKTIEKLEKEYDIASRRRKETIANHRTSKEELSVATEAALIFQSVASTVQRMWYIHLGRIVSKCLAAVFEDPYEFKLVFKQLANRTQVQFLLERDLEEFDPLTSTGGGVVDVASFALRIAALMLSVQGQRKLVIADEPFRFVSAQYRQHVRMLLERLAEEFDLQLILVTHNEEFEIGQVHEIV
jgi:DNA repair exonuclease SbcCD ATPase subunit